MERVREANEGKYFHSISYFHPRIALTGKKNFYQPFYEMMEQGFNVIVEVSKEKLKAIAASTVIAKALEINKSNLVLKRELLVLD